MQLHAARLCLDCQEVHAQTQCPVCASESFAALSRWVPVQERRARARATDGQDVAETYRRLLGAAATPTDESKTQAKWPRRAAFIVATLGVGGWLWRRSPSPRQSTGPREERGPAAPTDLR